MSDDVIMEWPINADLALAALMLDALGGRFDFTERQLREVGGTAYRQFLGDGRWRVSREFPGRPMDEERL